jgi:hypothetical protein
MELNKKQKEFAESRLVERSIDRGRSVIKATEAELKKLGFKIHRREFHGKISGISFDEFIEEKPRRLK